MQYPEENTSYPADVENNYGWLIQFTDGKIVWIYMFVH
ncbi:hypothetical protein [Clostridium tertium]